MAEYIEREALIEAFENADTDLCEDYGDTCDWGYGIKLVKEIVRSVPAAAVAPVVHGRWEQTEAPFMNECEDCSVCGYRTVWGHRFNYCPNCGAKMDGGEANA